MIWFGWMSDISQLASRVERGGVGLPISLHYLAQGEGQGGGGGFAFTTLEINVADPDPDPHVFGPPGAGSICQRYGSGAFCHHAKIVRKMLIPTILWLFLTFIFGNYVNVPSNSNKQKKCLNKNCFLLASWRSMMRKAGSGSISQRHGSTDPDPLQNVMYPEHWLLVCRGSRSRSGAERFTSWMRRSSGCSPAGIRPSPTFQVTSLLLRGTDPASWRLLTKRAGSGSASGSVSKGPGSGTPLETVLRTGFNADPDWFQCGFRFKTKVWWTKTYYFFDLILQFTSPKASTKHFQATGEAFSPQKRTSITSKRAVS